MKYLNVLLGALFVFALGSVQAAPLNLNPETELQEKISNKISSHKWDMLDSGEEVFVLLSFYVDQDHRIVMLGMRGENTELINELYDVLNGKKVDIKGLEAKTAYNVNIKIRKE